MLDFPCSSVSDLVDYNICRPNITAETQRRRESTPRACIGSIPGSTLKLSPRCRVATAVQSETVSQQSIRLPQPVPRNVAVDAYRGLVMFLMMAEVLRLSRVAQA